MKNTIQLKHAKSLKSGEYVLIPQHPNGILLARRIMSTESIDGGKRIEIGDEKGSIHVLSVEDTVAVMV